MTKGTLEKINFFGSEAPATPLSLDPEGATGGGAFVSDPMNIEDLVPGISEVKNTKKAVAMIEKALADRPVEYLVIWDPYEKKVVYAAKGDEHSVGFPVGGAEQFGDCIVTHNHPRKDPDVMGGTFSFADCSALTHGFNQIRAVSGSIPDRGTYTLDTSNASRRDLTNFLNQMNDVSGKLDMLLERVVAKHRKQLEERLAADGKTIRQGKPTKEEIAACFNEQLNCIDRFLCLAALKNNIGYHFEADNDEPEVKTRIFNRLKSWFENFNAAKSVDSSPEELDKIARKSSRSIAARVAKNPHASKDTLIYLAGAGHDVDVAKNPSADEELLTILYDNNNEMVVLGIAENENIPPKLAERIYDEYSAVTGDKLDIGALYLLARNPGTPKKILRKMKERSEYAEEAEATLKLQREMAKAAKEAKEAKAI